jgi:hypothetical protein
VGEDYFVKKKQGDVWYSCRATNTNGFPCLHNVKQAQYLGMDPYTLLHYLDTTEAGNTSTMLTLSSPTSPQVTSE